MRVYSNTKSSFCQRKLLENAYAILKKRIKNVKISSNQVRLEEKASREEYPYFRLKEEEDLCWRIAVWLSLLLSIGSVAKKNALAVWSWRVV
jgi:hypothetical protein